MIVVADAGPLIALAKVDALGVLLDLGAEVETTSAVYGEVVGAGRAIGAEDVPRLAPAFESGRLRVVQVTVPP